jgi:formylglycine-generating enzyme required for sulfatase activity
MGDTEMEGEKDEKPTHQVTLKNYKIAKTETTVAQWKVFCKATGRNMPETFLVYYLKWSPETTKKNGAYPKAE